MSMSYSLLEHLVLRRESLYLIDIRSRAEFKAMHIPGAHCFPYAELTATRIFQKLRALRQPICVISANGGARASLATGILRSAGCENVVPLAGGMNDWISRGLPVERKRFSLLLLGAKTPGRSRDGETTSLHDHEMIDDRKRDEPSFAGGVTT
jgi:rhodanese-related sulfurtransferase